MDLKASCPAYMRSAGGERVTYGGVATHCIPDLKLDLFPLNIDHPGPKLNSDCEIVNWLEPLVCKLEQETRLPHS